MRERCRGPQSVTLAMRMGSRIMLHLGSVRPKTLPQGVSHQTLVQTHRMSTQGSMSPCVASLQFQSQICCLHGELIDGSTTGDHKFKGEFGFAQTKPADVANAGSFATQTIISVYCRPKSALTKDVLSNVVMQLCSHTASVVEQPDNPLARQQLCAHACANVVTGVAVATHAAPPLDTAPPVAKAPPLALPPVAEAPPVLPVVPPVDVASVELPLPQAQTQEATQNTRTSDPTLFFNMAIPHCDRG